MTEVNMIFVGLTDSKMELSEVVMNMQYQVKLGWPVPVTTPIKLAAATFVEFQRRSRVISNCAYLRSFQVEFTLKPPIVIPALTSITVQVAVI